MDTLHRSEHLSLIILIFDQRCLALQSLILPLFDYFLFNLCLTCVCCVWYLVYFLCLFFCDQVQLCSPPVSSSHITSCIHSHCFPHALSSRLTSCAVPNVFACFSFLWTLMFPVSPPSVLSWNKHTLCLTFAHHVLHLGPEASTTPWTT